MEFQEAYSNFFKELGNSKKMVLSTSLHDIVTSRMMSIVVLGQKLYFQTDKTFRKYSQLKGNPNVALCMDNIQIQGRCEEIGKPLLHTGFSEAYKKYFFSSYQRYTALETERLFAVTPTFIERWLYLDNVPYLEWFDVEEGKYQRRRYLL